MGLWRLGLVYFEGAFFNLFLPTLIGGDIVRGYFIYKMTRGHDASIASILVDRLCGSAALILIAVTALALAYGTLNDPQVAFGILTVVACFAGAMLVLLNRWLTIRVSGVLSVIGLARFQVKLHGLVDALQRYRRHHRALAQAFLLSALLQALIIVTYYLIGVGLNLGVPLLYFFLFVPLVTAVSMLPVSVAGLGVREGGVIYFFGKVGVKYGGTDAVLSYLTQGDIHPGQTLVVATCIVTLPYIVARALTNRFVSYAHGWQATSSASNIRSG